jgi:cytochrome c553
MSRSGRRLALAAACATLAAIFGSGCRATSAASPVPGSALYKACVNCHGPAGEGSVASGAPRIAGLPQWYLASQLQRFQDGLRGKHPDDADGLRMRAMAQQMMSAAEIASVAGYVSHLAPVTNPATLPQTDAESARAVFARCAACHGPRGEGNQEVHAPPLAGQDDWYVARQLRKFRAGIRGKAPNDPVGPIMQAMSLSVDPPMIERVAAYVHALSK